MSRPISALQRSPSRPGEVWIHIDRLTKRSRSVWAVQSIRNGRPSYRVASKVFIVEDPGVMRTRFHEGNVQPRAYVQLYPAMVKWSGTIAWIRRAE